MEWIVPNAQKNAMEPIVFTFEKDGESKEYTPFEGEEFGYVLKGKISLAVGEKEYTVNEGETFYLVANETRKVKNVNKGVSKLLWISNPPNF